MLEPPANRDYPFSSFNPSDAEATFVQSSRTQRPRKLGHLNPVVLVFIG